MALVAVALATVATPGECSNRASMARAENVVKAS
jgi:hypothetical protein